MDEKKSGSKKNLFIILGIIVIIVIVGLVIYFQYGKPETPLGGETEGPGPEGTEEPTVQTPKEIDEIIREAIDTQNASLCEKLRKEENKEFCKINVTVAEATVKRDVNICNRVKDENTKAACIDNVITGQAMDTKDPSVCEEITDETRREQCERIATQ